MFIMDIGQVEKQMIFYFREKHVFGALIKPSIVIENQFKSFLLKQKFAYILATQHNDLSFLLHFSYIIQSKLKYKAYTVCCLKASTV